MQRWLSPPELQPAYNHFLIRRQKLICWDVLWNPTIIARFVKEFHGGIGNKISKNPRRLFLQHFFSWKRLLHKRFQLLKNRCLKRIRLIQSSANSSRCSNLVFKSIYACTHLLPHLISMTDKKIAPLVYRRASASRSSCTCQWMRFLSYLPQLLSYTFTSCWEEIEWTILPTTNLVGGFVEFETHV